MSEQEPGPSQNPYGQPTDPYGQPATPNPYGQAPPPNPYGQAYEQQSQPAYGVQPTTSYGSTPTGDARPGGVTAAGWITIILSALSAAMFGLVAVLFLVARDQIVTEMNKTPEFRDLDVDGDSIVGVMVAFMLVLVLWAVISLVLGVFVLRRSNVARILLVISSSVVALGSLLGITSGFSAIWLIAAIAVIVMLFINGAGNWFSRTPTYPGGGPGGPGGYGGGYQYGGEQGGYGQPGSGTQPGGYGEQPSSGTPPQDGTHYPPTDYPGRS